MKYPTPSLTPEEMKRLREDGYLIRVADPAAAKAEGERRSPEIIMTVPRSCFTDDEIKEMQRRGFA